MATFKQRRRLDVIKVWTDNAASTADRDTDYNDLQNKWNLSESYLASRWDKARKDIIL